MWIYLGITLVVGITGYLAKNRGWIQPCAVVYTAIRQHGLGICLQWTKQISTYQLAQRIVEMHHKYYVVHYPFGVHWYKIIIPRKRGPCKISRIVDAEEQDVTREIMSYLGPSYNFHGMVVTPGMLGYDRLTFHFIDDTTKTFERDTRIVL